MNYAEYQASTDPNKFLDGCPCISCSDAKVRARNLVESMRTTINAERGLAPAPKLDLQGNPTTVDWRKNLEELLPFVPLETALTLDMQKNLRDYRESMGNPLPPADASPRPLSAVEAMLNNDAKVNLCAPMRLTIDYKKLLEQVQWPSRIGFCDNGPCAHEKCPGCKNWIATYGYKIGEERRKEGGYATLIAVPLQADENKGKFRMRVEARLDELNFVSAMAWEITQKDWFKRRVEELLEMLK